MAVVTVYARHSGKCSKSAEKNSGQYKRCNCNLWLQWNKNKKQFKRSAKTRSWDIATKAARKVSGIATYASSSITINSYRVHRCVTGLSSLLFLASISSFTISAAVVKRTRERRPLVKANLLRKLSVAVEQTLIVLACPRRRATAIHEGMLCDQAPPLHFLGD